MLECAPCSAPCSGPCSSFGDPISSHNVSKLKRRVIFLPEKLSWCFKAVRRDRWWPVFSQRCHALTRTATSSSRRPLSSHPRGATPRGVFITCQTLQVRVNVIAAPTPPGPTTPTHQPRSINFMLQKTETEMLVWVSTRQHQHLPLYKVSGLQIS